MKESAFKFYGTQDPRSLPAYAVAEAAHYLLIPGATLRSWVVGRPYPTMRGRRFFKSVIAASDKRSHRLSFVNLVEVHVLDAIRREHRIPLDKVRAAIDYLKEQFGSEHPLAEHRFETDGLNLFVEKYGQLIDITRAGQLVIRDLIKAHLRRIDHDETGMAIRLYPFTRKRLPEEPKSIVIDPRISFGRPVIAGTGIPTVTVAERYKAGDSVEQLAEDYGRARLDIEEAIRCELQLEAA